MIRKYKNNKKSNPFHRISVSESIFYERVDFRVSFEITIQDVVLVPPEFRNVLDRFSDVA